MKKLYLTFGITLCFLSAPAFAGQQNTDIPHWINKAIEAKMQMQSKMSGSSAPILSDWILCKQPAVSLSADLAGKKQLILFTRGGIDGTKDDQAVWANARLQKPDGSYVWLDELKYTIPDGRKQTILKNKNTKGAALSIGKNKYKHGILNSADGMLIYNLENAYTRFETETGIENRSSSGSAYFGILTFDPTADFQQFKQKFPQTYNNVEHLVKDVEWWLIAPGISYEITVAETLIDSLKSPSFYQNKLIRIKTEKDYSKQLASMIGLINELDQILVLQAKLAWLNPTAIGLALKEMSKSSSFDTNRYQQMWKELKHLVAQGFDSIYQGDTLAIANAEKALKLKRDILLANPLLDTDKIIAARYILGKNDRDAMAPQLGTQNNNWSNQGSASRGGFQASIVEISNLRGKINLREIYRATNTSPISDLRLHWDGDRVMFTHLKDDRRWNIFEVKLDGSGFHPLIENDEPDLEFFDGTYLPDGRIIANSNIGYHRVPCLSGSNPVGNMVLYTPKDKSLRRLTFDQDGNWNPVIMNNGRVMYTRWEYTDLTHYYSRLVMHMNPDGTENKALYGSGSMFPNSTFDVQPLPGTGSAFVGIISGHHGIARSGRIIIFDPTRGRKNVAGIVQEIPHRNRPVKEEIKDRLVDGVWPQFIKPTALNDKFFLVAAKLTPHSLWGIYLVDVFDNVTCIAEAEGEGFISPTLVRRVPTPPAIPDKVKLDQKEATFFIQDIYEGEGLRGIPRGTVKELRLHAYEYAYVSEKSDHNWHGIQSGWDIKRQLGTVPVEEDGSVIFKAPANTPISIQPIDKDGVAIQWMRSWVTGQPGEVVSCIGCHENQNQIAIPKRVIASQKVPSTITPPEGGIRSFTFDLEIQPILDRACITCHNGDKAFDLRGGKKDQFGYGTSYLKFHPYIHRQGGEGDMVVLQPYEYHPNTSELVRMLKRGHHNVKLTEKEWRTLYNWIDYNAPDKGYYNVSSMNKTPYKGFSDYTRRMELADKYAGGSSVDWKKELADYASYLKGKGEIKPEMPESEKEIKVRELKVKGWPFDATTAQTKQTAEGKIRKTIELAPGIRMTFIRIPAGQFIMGSYNGPSDTYPTSKVKIDKSFWMAELETTNEQYNVFFPEHDSRFIDQQWKDHVVQGYPANKPEQPVIRVSYNDAMAFCKALSEKTGLNVTLPTEAQWEWACRAGSDTDFWYGNLGVDFGTKENLADKTTLLFAVAGVDPQPMTPNHPMYKHYTFLPKEENVDDGNLVQIGGKVYEANPFGLYNMHGNVGEWTRSNYVSYPYKAKNEEEEAECKVVRGGSFIERPRFSTSYSRKGFLPYQRIFNVGFRVIIEE